MSVYHAHGLRRRPNKRTNTGHCYSSGSEPPDYTAAEVEFMRAMERFARERNPYPTCGDVLQVAKSLGYERKP